ncbi:protein unc-80 homolog [Lineus longissimus]|uniref:protein unc-80 homolog n=1 Tax=Lineus longissimus TaxID=88925 RepID=UPI00315CFD51
MPKRKFDDDQAVDQTVPLPIQTFLWRQTSPFIRPKLGKLCEASCVSFERVLVQNILHGLSPSLCDSIQSISRWRLIQASFPHVMHCCAAVLGNRKQNFPDTKFGISETKLLYTLHWIILDAASECDDADSALPGYQKPATLPLHSLSGIQLFVYLFAPLVQSLKESDFQSLKLENGLRLWQPLWDYHQPDIPCFATPVRPKRNVLKAQRSLLKLNTNAANIYIGKGSSTDNIYLGPEPVIMSRGSVVESSSPLAPLARMSDICGTISDTQSVSMEVVCEVCNTVLYGTASQNGSCCKCGRKDSLILMPDSKIANMSNLQKLTSPLQNLDKDFIKKRIETAIAQSAAAQGPPNPDILSASYFDVAVLRCLFSPSWVEDGVYWSLRYIHQRLLEVSDDLVRQEFTRERSKSLPVPEITVSVYRPAPPSPPMRPDSEDEISLPDRDTGCYINRSSYSIGPPPSPTPNKDYPHKRIRSVRQLFESKTKLARIESIDQDEIEIRLKQSHLNKSSEEMQIEIKDSDGEKDKDKDYMTIESAEEGTPPPRPSSAMGRYRDPGNESMDEEDDDDDDQSGSFSDLVRRRSMPVITQCGTDSESAVSLTPIASPQNKKDPVGRTMSLKPEMLTKPIITITEDSPSPSPTPSDWSRKRESIASEKFEHANRPGLHRSFTDTNISYLCEEEVEEVGGSVHYIDSKGHINCRVVLKAVHFVAINDLSARCSDVMLNILNVLMDLEVIEKKGDSKKEQLKKMAESCGDELPDSAKMAAEKKEEEMTLHNMAMDTVIRIFKALGCPHGCGDGFRGPLGEHVRSHGLNCLQRLQRFNSTQFRKYLREFIRKRPVQEVVDFLHAFLGFCADSGVPSATYSPPAQKKNAGDNTNRSGFAINFGHSIGGAGKGVEGQVIAHILKPMVSRFVDSKKDLAGHENISLYCDVRQMVNFIKEQHGGTFRRVALSGLLDSANRPAKKRDKGKGHSTAVSQILYPRRSRSPSPTHGLSLLSIRQSLRRSRSWSRAFSFLSIRGRQSRSPSPSPSMLSIRSHCRSRSPSPSVSRLSVRSACGRRSRSKSPAPVKKSASSQHLCIRKDLRSRSLSPAPSKDSVRTMSMTSESGDEREPGKSTSTGNVDEVGNTQGKSRRSIFKRRTKKNTSSSNILSAASDSEMNDNEFGRHHIKLSPRMSMSAAEDDPPSGPSTPKRKFSKFNIGGGNKQRNKHGNERHSDHGRQKSSSTKEKHSAGVLDKKSNGKKQVKGHVPVYGRSLSHNYPLFGHGRGSGHGHGWRRSAKSDHEDDSTTDLSQFAENRRESVHQRGKRMSFKAAGQATLTFLTARKRLEDSLKSFGKKRLSKRGSIDDDLMRRGSLEVGNSHQAEVIIFKEKKLVDAWAVKSGMLRFSFFMDCIQPGSVPDPQLVAAMLDLEAPVVARGALLLECAHFVHRCNRGDWPNWMRLNLPSFRLGGPLQSRGQPSGYKRNTLLQRTAGRMFYMWAEALGLKLEQILMQEHKDKFDHIHQVKDDNRKKELREADDDEDFMDEATVNHTGSDCPHALKMVACQLLLEITTFLRETYQYIPKIKASKREHTLEKASQRWSSVLSSPVHSDRSSASFTDQPYASLSPGSPGDRKISFAVLGEQRERSDSLHSSTTTISAAAGDPDDKKERRVAQGRKLLKMRRNSELPPCLVPKAVAFSAGLKRMGSMRSRKVSVQSIKSEKSDDEITAPPQHNSLDVESPDEMAESPEYDTDDNLCTYMPWIKVIIQLANTSNFICDHQNFCHPNCYERQQRSCTRLMNATFKVYDCEEPENVDEDGRKLDDSKKDTFREKLKRRLSPSKSHCSVPKESVFQPSSPIRRRESTPLLDKIRSDVNLAKLMKIDANRDKKDPCPRPKKKEDTYMVKYLKSQVQKLCHSPMALMSKASPVLQDDHFVDMLPVAWELLLENDQELASAAASVFILSAIKVPEQVQEMMTKELQHEDTNQRINAILRYSILWRFRYQMWPRMEEGANMFFKVPPPSIDFVLPSPTIGNPTQTIVDPPWMPHFKTKVEEVTLSQEGSKSLVTATTTRRKQQQEMIHQALIAEEDRKREAREKFLINTINASQLAANEPALHHSTDEHDEAIPEEINMAARRMSVAPSRASNFQIRSLSWRNGSMHWARSPLEDEEQVERAHTQPMQLAQPTFPSCICAAVLPIIHLLDDLEVNQDGISVSEVAEKIIWWCLVEDPPLFFRHFLEKLTKKESQDELFFVLRRLMIRMPTLPAQTAHTIFNYIIGFVMFYVRSPCEGSQEAIGGALSMLWMIVPSVQGIYFKDLKQTLRKEQCDPTLLVTANVPSAKKVVVHGTDLTSIPSQFPIHEDTQFSMILEDSIDFFNIPDNEKNTCFLVDTKSNQMHNLNSYVRDLYFFRRNFYPQLSLVNMDPQDAFNTLQKQAFTMKFVEIGKVMFATEVLQSTAPHQMQTHVNFLHEELTKLPSFPRKALEAEFNLYKGEMGKELYGLDMLHKFAWARMVNSLFHSMTSTFNWMGDIPLFLNVINGTFLLHCDDIAMLRFCLSSYISTSRHFKHVFATNGFMYVIPTVVRVYANHQNNPVLCQAIEFTCKQFYILHRKPFILQYWQNNPVLCQAIEFTRKQFYILHRKPFILQMFGSLASILDSDENSDLIDCNKSYEYDVAVDVNKVPPKCLFNLLMSLESQSRDNLLILDMVHGDMPLKALDFCYEMDPDTFSMIDAINVCVAVVAYASDSYRGMQMLTILEAIVPFYLRKMKTETNKLQTPIAARQEINTISNMAVSMRALINSCEALTRLVKNISGPQRHIENVNANVNKPCANHSSAVYYDDREDSVFKYMEEGRHNQYNYAAHDEDDEIRSEYRKPRDSLLNITAEFFATCLPRLKELRKMLADPSFKFPELLDYKAHIRLADIAHTLLKIAPYDPLVMGSRGLQRYITEILPITDWSIEAVRPALNLILRRLDRLFNKIYKKTSLRRHLNWDCAANLLKGVYLTLTKYQYIAHLPHLKTVINMCLNIILSDVGSSSIYDSLHNVHYGNRNEQVNNHLAAPPRFCSAVVKLMATQMQCLGEQFSVEHICGGMSVFPSPEKTQNMLVNLILPLCIRVGCGRRDAPKVRPADISFILTVVLNAILPPTHMPQNPKNQLLSVGEIGRLGSSSGSDRSSNKVVRDAVMQTAFLGLKIIMVCFQNKLSSEWHRIAKCVQEMASVTGRHAGGVHMWQFIDFVVTIRPPLFVILYPFIQYKLMKLTCESEHEYYLQQLIGQRLKGHLLPAPKSSGSTLIELANELRVIKDDMTVRGPGDDIRPRTNTNETTTRIDIPKENASQNARPRHLPRPSIADLMDPSFGVRVLPLPTEKRSSKGAGLSPITPVPYVPPSQTAPPPPDAVEEEKIEATEVTGVEAAPDEDEPHLLLRRHSSRRITADEGNRILEKYTSKPEAQTEAEFLASLHCPTSRTLQRQASIYYSRRGYISKQHNVFESTDEYSLNPIPDLDDDNPIRHIDDDDYHVTSLDFDGDAEESLPPKPHDERLEEDQPIGSASPDMSGYDPRSHRLQRADAKSRKTFKIKRAKTSIRKQPATRTVSAGFGIRPDEMLQPSQDEQDSLASKKAAKLKRAKTSYIRKGASIRDVAPVPVDAEHLPQLQEESELQRHYIPKSKSNEDGPFETHHAAGTARARIARQGGRIIRSRSPSTSPVRHARSPATSPTREPELERVQQQTYMSRTDSVESITTSENSALLKQDEKTKSQSSLCIYFDANDVQDTCV